MVTPPLAGLLMIVVAASMTYISRRTQKPAAELVIWIAYFISLSAGIVILAAAR